MAGYRFPLRIQDGCLQPLRIHLQNRDGSVIHLFSAANDDRIIVVACG